MAVSSSSVSMASEVALAKTGGCAGWTCAEVVLSTVTEKSSGWLMCADASEAVHFAMAQNGDGGGVCAGGDLTVRQGPSAAHRATAVHRLRPRLLLQGGIASMMLTKSIVLLSGVVHV